MSEERKVQTEEIESPEDNEALDATELEEESLEDVAGGGDIGCNRGCNIA